LRVLVFELNPYHTETFSIYSYYLPKIFNQKVDIKYFVLPQKYNDLKEEVYKNDIFQIVSKNTYFFIKHFGLRKVFYTLKIKQLIKNLNPDLIIFNSVEPKGNFQIFKKINFKKKWGLIHNPLSNDIENIASFFVLSKTLYEKYQSKYNLLGYMLPYFKEFDFQEKKFNQNKIIIGAQGIVKFSRKDFLFLIKLAKKLKEKNISNIKFNIIGSENKKDWIKLKKQILTEKLESFFILHKSLSDEKFFKEINDCDFLIALLHERQKIYFEDKISATLSHAAAYSKPLILWDQNAKAWEIDKEGAIVYKDLDDLVDKLQNMNYDKMKEDFKKQIEEKIKRSLEYLLIAKQD